MARTLKNPEKQLSRRAVLVGGAQAAAFTGIAGRLAYLQFVHADTYAMLSEENRVKLQVVAPPRGVVLDRAERPLAENTPNYRLLIEREALEPTLSTLRRVMRLLDWPEETRASIEHKVRQTRRYKSVTLKDQLSWDELVKLEFHLAELPGLTLEEGQLRHYPLAEKAAHLVGYVGRVAKEDQEKLTALARLPDFKIGKNGIEQAEEEALRGQGGRRELEVNALGVTVRELAYESPKPGAELKLTVDAELQAFAAERLGEESGSVVVMDAQYGDLLCCASMPAFDPNRFSRGIGREYWKSLRENERGPLLNKAFSGMYPPASTFKMLVALAGLEAGVINEKTAFFCPGHYRLGNRRFNCWKPAGHGWTNLTHAIAESCDTFFYNIGERLGIDAITDMARRFGLGEVSGLGLVGEKSGLLPSDDWKRQTHDVPWVKGDTINASIGQGFMLATPLQLAIMTARMVSGRKVSPRLLHGELPPEPPLMDIDTSYLQQVVKGMNAATGARYGTAYWRRIMEEGMEMGGKTGTAQVRRIIQRGLDQSKLPWRHRHHGLFVGYAPVHNPSLVVSVVIEHGGGGSSAAAPVARDVLLKAQQLAKGYPTRYRL